jgi:O-methyltransferase
LIALKKDPEAESNDPPGLKPARGAIYDVNHAVSHSRPYDVWYKEKVPLLEIFRTCALDVKARALNDPLHRLAFALGAKPKMVAAECGVYRGHSLVACSKIARDLGLNCTFIGLDSFEGLPTLSETDLQFAPDGIPYRTRTFFADAPVQEVRATVADAGFAGSVKLVRGFFSETLSTLSEAAYDFVNIDCDLYEPHLECLEYFYPRTKKGGVIFFDDYHSADFPMARRAIDTFMSDKPETLFHLRFGVEGVNHTKAYILKS